MIKLVTIKCTIKLGLVYENVTLGRFQFFADDFESNYYYNQILIFDNRM
jgi:hypothetical protein